MTVAEKVIPELVSLPIYFRFIKANELKVDQANYQRDVKPKLVARIVSTFNPRALGALRVGQRSDGGLWIEDGLQRWTAVTQIDPEYVLACMVYDDSRMEVEAEDFWIVNHNRQTLQPREMFRARLASGDMAAKNIVATVGQFGLKVSLRPGRLVEGEVECIQLLDDLYATNRLVTVLGLAVDAWGRFRPRAFQRSVLAGMRDVVDQYAGHNAFDRERLVEGLRSHTPESLVQTAYQLGIENRYRAMARAIVQAYNKTAGKALPAWNRRSEELRDSKPWEAAVSAPIVRFRGTATPRLTMSVVPPREEKVNA